MIYQALRCLEASRIQIQRSMIQIKKLNKKLHDDRLIYQAKLVLIEQYHWSEEKAHHYIEQAAMNSGQKKSVVAQMILDKTLINL